MAEQDLPTDWQTEKSTVLERNTFMFLNEIMSDVKFRVGEQAFPAHKYVLATSSPVFYAMFFGPVAEKSDEIEINDADPVAFKEMLRFLYTDHTELTDLTVVQVLDLSEKYTIPALKRLCTKFLEDGLSLGSVLQILTSARCYNLNGLAEKCLALINLHTEEILQSEEFTEVPVDILKLLLEEKHYSVSEIEIFRAANRWAEARCVEASQEVNGSNLRHWLGDCIKLIRFPAMSYEELITEVFSTEILTTSEIVDVSRAVKKSKSHRSCYMFNDSRRCSTTENSILRCCFDIRSTGRQVTIIRSCYEMCFSVSTAINVVGFAMIGSCNRRTDVAALHVYSERPKRRQLTQLTGREFTSFTKIDSGGSVYHGFDILLDRPVRINPSDECRVSVLFSGTIAEYDYKDRTVTGHGVQFNLMEISNPHTSISCLFSEIMFKTLQ